MVPVRMNLQSAMQAWIECSWQEMGRNFGADDLPVTQYEKFCTDDLSFPFKNVPIRSWRLVLGKLQLAKGEKISRVPYIAFCLDELDSAARVQVQWAPRCGYGWDLTFGPVGEVVAQKMRWVS